VADSGGATFGTRRGPEDKGWGTEGARSENNSTGAYQFFLPEGIRID